MLNLPRDGTVKVMSSLGIAPLCSLGFRFYLERAEAYMLTPREVGIGGHLLVMLYSRKLWRALVNSGYVITSVI